MRYFWGLVLVAVGAGYLSASLGYISYDQLNKLWLWWPLILIFIGLDILTRNLKYGWAIMIACTVIFGLVIYDVSFAPRSYTGLSSAIETSSEVRSTEVKVPLKDSYKSSKVELDVGAMDLSVGLPTSEVAVAKLQSSFAELSSQISETGDQVSAKISTLSFRRHMMWFGGDYKNELDLSLNKELPTSLKVNSGASKLDLDLSKYKISGLDIDAGASSIDIKLGEGVVNESIVNLESGASEITILAPKGIGVSVTTESGLSSNDFRNFTKVGDKYESAGYSKAKTKITVNLKTGASSVRIEQY